MRDFREFTSGKDATHVSTNTDREDEQQENFKAEHSEESDNFLVKEEEEEEDEDFAYQAFREPTEIEREDPLDCDSNRCEVGDLLAADSFSDDGGMVDEGSPEFKADEIGESPEVYKHGGGVRLPEIYSCSLCPDICIRMNVYSFMRHLIFHQG